MFEAVCADCKRIQYLSEDLVCLRLDDLNQDEIDLLVDSTSVPDIFTAWIVLFLTCCRTCCVHEILQLWYLPRKYSVLSRMYACLSMGVLMEAVSRLPLVLVPSSARLLYRLAFPSLPRLASSDSTGGKPISMTPTLNFSLLRLPLPLHQPTP